MVRALAVVALAACGEPPVGVSSIQFSLKPSVSGSFPDGFDVGRLALATGTLAADCAAGTGSVAAQNLPEAPEGYAYVLVLTFGASEYADIAPSTAAGLPADLIVGVMEASGDGSFIRSFVQDDFDKPLGALRAASVLLFKTSGATRTGTALSGQATTSNAGTASGHVHGV